MAVGQTDAAGRAGSVFAGQTEFARQHYLATPGCDFVLDGFPAFVYHFGHFIFLKWSDQHALAGPFYINYRAIIGRNGIVVAGHFREAVHGQQHYPFRLENAKGFFCRLEKACAVEMIEKMVRENAIYTFRSQRQGSGVAGKHKALEFFFEKVVFHNPGSLE